jgi:hypothetical protein
MEPGADGVGDYTRDLAAECGRRGHACVIAAINDRFVDRPREEWQDARGSRVEVLRLPASAKWEDRSRVARDWLARWPSDWLSLQFVPYGFHPKGVVAGLAAQIAPLVRSQRVHLMLHELWLGLERGAPIKHRLVGWLQQQAVLKLVKSLSPQIVHTSNAAYRAVAFAKGIPAELLPLCGNIPIVAGADPHWMEAEAEKLGVRPPPRAQTWWFGMFGSLHPEWSPEPVFSYIAEAAEKAGRHVVMGAIGRLGRGEPMWHGLQEKYSPRFSFVMFGERGAADVSAFLQGIDFGIATTPWALIGKSGTAAAMLEHGVPVIVTRDDVRFALPSEPESDALLCKMSPTLPQWLLDAPRRQPARSRQGEMVDAFLADLEAAGSSNRRLALTRFAGLPT